MPLIAANRSLKSVPEVRVTTPKSARQIRIALNAALMQTHAMANAVYVAIDHDEETRSLTFIPSGTMYGGVPTHRLLHDGGRSKGPSRAVYTTRSALAFLPAGSYAPVVLKKGFVIHYRRAARNGQ